MSDEVAALLPFVYVRDVARSVEFYRLLGFDRQAGGADDTWRWAYLAAGTAGLIVASDGTPPAADPGPALLYVSVADLGAALGRLAEAGVAAEHLGYPDHAPGGEARVADPDNHGLILAQPTGVPGGAAGVPRPRTQPAAAPAGGPAAADPDEGADPSAAVSGADAEPADRRGTLEAAAAAVARRGIGGHPCQVGGVGGEPCPAMAEVKLADSWGDTAWSCLRHAEEVVVNARGAFIAAEDAQGLGQYLRARARTPLS